MKKLKSAISFLLAGAMLTGTLFGVSASVSAAEEKAPSVSVSAGKFPSSFDLRDLGVVTPVKNQNPWGVCWAFSAIAAAETSILTAMGSTYEQTGLDLSERYLAWYVTQPVPEAVSASQAGEGLVAYGQETDPNVVFDIGGMDQCAATLFAQGIGPVSEEDYPYRGAEGYLAYEDLIENRDAHIENTYEELKKSYGFFLTDDELREWAEELYEAELEDYSIYDAYSPYDDWSIDEADKPGSGRLRGSAYTLTDNHVFTYWIRTGTDGKLDPYEKFDKEPLYSMICNTIYEEDNTAYNLYQESIDQIKSELLAGRGVSVGISLSGGSINYDNWAVYNTLCDLVPNHVACIVGWDDNYPAENFTLSIDSGEEELSDEETAAENTTPPGNGAWIVKNSWGSETDLIPGGLVGPDGTAKDLYAFDWGIPDENGKHTGYFYLSYFDGSLTSPESFEFEIRANKDQETALQYDYLPASVGEWDPSDDSPMWEANIYTLKEDMRIDAVATRIRMTKHAPISGFLCSFELYKLRDGAERPDDGELIATVTRMFDSQGYHRAALDAPVYLEAGDRLGVVVQQSHTYDDGTTRYCISAQETDKYRKYPVYPIYGNFVVNKGESFLKWDGVTDREADAIDGWFDLTTPMTKELLWGINPDMAELTPGLAEFYEREAVGTPMDEFLGIDNFCIKVFGEPATPEDEVPEDEVPVDNLPQPDPAGKNDQNDYDWILGSMIAGRAFNPPKKDADSTAAVSDAEPVPVPENVPETIPEAKALPFTDVTPDSPYLEDIQYVYENDLMNGMSETEFGEYHPLTRAMIVTVLHRMEGTPEFAYTGAFDDVPAGEWYSEGVEWAASNGIVKGYGDGRFGPMDNVTREQLAVILYRFANFHAYDVSIGEDTNILSYDDAFDISDWAMNAVQWACGTDVLNSGNIAAIRPTEPATRGEIAHAIHAFCETVEK